MGLYSHVRSRTGSPGTVPTSYTDQQCCTHFPTVVCGRLDFCEFQQAKRPYTLIFPSSICCNTVRQNPTTQGTQRANTAQTLKTNVRINPTGPTTAQPTYCKVVLLVAFHHKDPTFSLTALRAGGVGTSPPIGINDSFAAPELTNNATTTPD